MGENFAQFYINVDMGNSESGERKLNFIDKEYVEFTFTCPFLKPVKGSEVLVDGAPVPVEVNYDSSPYTYKIPVSALTDSDGIIQPFTFVVQWRPQTGGYKESDLNKEMKLTTAKAQKADLTDKTPVITTGSICGWINPMGGGLSENPDAANAKPESNLF